MSDQTPLDRFIALYKQFEVVDLSPLLENGAPKAPTHPSLVIHPTITHEHDGYFCQTIFLPEHIGFPRGCSRTSQPHNDGIYD